MTLQALNVTGDDWAREDEARYGALVESAEARERRRFEREDRLAEMAPVRP